MRRCGKSTTVAGRMKKQVQLHTKFNDEWKKEEWLKEGKNVFTV